MTKDEELAMDLALEALEYIHEGANNQGPHTGISWRCVAVKAEPAIKAIKQARALDKMAENARELGLDYEPVAPVQEDWGPGPHECHSLTASPVQEPVAWTWHQAPVKTQWGDDMVVADLAIDKDHTVSVYCERDQTAKVEAMLTPPAAQRQSARSAWVGLTDAEVMQTMSGDWTSQFYFARAIEAKLKELNK